MSKTKSDRNKELLKKLKEGWSFRKIADHFNIAVSRAHQISVENSKKKTAFRAVDKKHLTGVQGNAKIKTDS